MLAALLGAASTVSKLGGLFGAKNDYRPARAAEALQIALDGGPHALTAARLIFKQRTASGTADGRSAYASAWATLQQRSPALAQQAQSMGGVDDPPATDPTFPAPGSYSGLAVPVDTRSGVQVELERLADNVREDAGDAAQRLIAGASNSLTGQIAPGAGLVNIPTSTGTIALVVGVIVVIGVLIFALRR